jgi:isoleucyl-tRNA synthetase
VQNARRAAGLQVEDRIELTLGGDGALLAAAAAHRDYLAGETLAVELLLQDAGDQGGARDQSGARGYAEQTDVDGLALAISLRRAQRDS